jgi:hypothetical protein
LLNVAFWHYNFRNRNVLKRLIANSNFQHCCWRIMARNSIEGRPRFDTDVMSINLHLSLHVYILTGVYIFLCLPPQYTLHTAVTHQGSVLFSFAFSSYTEQSQVSTDHCFCCFVLWTHTSHRQINLWVKERISGVMAIEFASII